MGDMQGPDMADECRAACAEKREVRCAIDGPQGADDIGAEKGRATTRDCDGARGHAARAAAWGHFSGTEFADRCGALGPDAADGRANALAAIVLLVLFVLWTWAVSTVDVRPIGPGKSCVGLASLNEAFHRWTGVHMGLYLATDWLSLVPVCWVLVHWGLCSSCSAGACSGLTATSWYSGCSTWCFSVLISFSKNISSIGGPCSSRACSRRRIPLQLRCSLRV